MFIYGLRHDVALAKCGGPNEEFLEPSIQICRETALWNGKTGFFIKSLLIERTQHSSLSTGIFSHI
jgi:hypothetical protein